MSQEAGPGRLEGPLDTSSMEWLEHCEAVSLVKKYIRTLWSAGDLAAQAVLQNACEARSKLSAQRAHRLREHIEQIWKTQRHEIAEALRAAEDGSTTGTH